MLSKQKAVRFIADNSHYILVATVLLISQIIYSITGHFQQEFSQAMSIASYLSWHNILEVASILISFAVFSVTFHTYQQNGGLRMLLIGNVFLVTGIIDTFHTLSFKGMSDFFIPNTGANRATTLWIIARLIGSSGLLVSFLIPEGKKVRFSRYLITIPATVFCFLVFITVTYYPKVLPAMYIEGKGLTTQKIFLEYVIILILIISIFKLLLEYSRSKEFLLIHLSCALAVSIFSELAFVSYKDVFQIYNYLGHIYKAIAFYIIFRVFFIFSVQRPYKELSLAKNELKEYAENLDVLVDKRTQELKRMNQKFLEDMEYAKDLQKAIMPAFLPDEKCVAFCAKYIPLESVGGDFYNITKLDNDHIGILIGDVSGHGVHAAMLSVFMHKSVNTIRELNKKKSQIISPSNVLKDIYKTFNNTNFKDNLYVVMLYGVYNIKSKELTYCSAGLNVQPIIIDTDGKIQDLRISGLPIMKLIEFVSPQYKDSTIKLKAGERILFYTDGLVDAVNKHGVRYSDERLKGVLEKNCSGNAFAICDAIENSINAFIDSNTLKDDITYFVMEVKE